MKKEKLKKSHYKQKRRVKSNAYRSGLVFFSFIGILRRWKQFREAWNVAYGEAAYGGVPCDAGPCGRAKLGSCACEVEEDPCRRAFRLTCRSWECKSRLHHLQRGQCLLQVLQGLLQGMWCHRGLHRECDGAGRGCRNGRRPCCTRGRRKDVPKCGYERVWKQLVREQFRYQ